MLNDVQRNFDNGSIIRFIARFFLSFLSVYVLVMMTLVPKKARYISGILLNCTTRMTEVDRCDYRQELENDGNWLWGEHCSGAMYAPAELEWIDASPYVSIHSNVTRLFELTGQRFKSVIILS